MAKETSKLFQGAETWTVTATDKSNTDFLEIKEQVGGRRSPASGEDFSSTARTDASCLAQPRQIKCLFMGTDCSSLAVHPVVFKQVEPKTLTLCMCQEGRKAKDGLYCSTLCLAQRQPDSWLRLLGVNTI